MKTFLPLFFIFAMACSPKMPTGHSLVKRQEPVIVNIIPMPAIIQSGNGAFTIDDKTSVSYSKELKNEAQFLINELKNRFTNIGNHQSSQNIILLKLGSYSDLGKEGYKLLTSKDKITVSANTSKGVFYGIQSLLQLIPLDSSQEEITLKNINIVDKPAFQWRAFMLDEARYFKGMKVVKGLLDQMALLKMNIFHWHLVDDQGWRIEIKKYPKLTEIGSYRKYSNVGGYAGEGGWKSQEYTDYPHNGFYTQEEIREIVQYAKDRHISVIPEIEMPGHCKSAVASYPWLGTTGESIEVPVKFGAGDGSYNVANPKVIEFLKDVITEVIALFPDKIIHIGGDEVRYGQWEKSSYIQNYMKENNIKTPADLQIHFTNNMSTFIASKGYRMMGWNDVLGGVHDYQNPVENQTSQTLEKSTIIHFWKGNIDLLRQAVTNGYDIVNSYHLFTYLDYRYVDLPLEKAYRFSPIPDSLDVQYHDKVLGLGCEMWGEWIPTVKDMERQVYPRLAAYAEIGWTPVGQKDFDHFKIALKQLEKRWINDGISIQQQ